VIVLYVLFPLSDNNTTSYTYNQANEVVTQESPTGGLTSYAYDLVGNLLSMTDPDDHTITYSYDADNEVTGETWVNPAGGKPLDVFNYTYNADGEVTQLSDDNSAYAYTYNADGEVMSQSDAGSPDLPTVTLTYDYDADGNRTAMDDSLGGLVSYVYDARDELTNETLSGSGLSAMAVANSYDNAGNMTGQTRYSNLTESTVVAATSYTYDNAELMTGITDKNSSGSTLVSYGYTYNAAELVSQETRSWASGSSTDTLSYGYTNNNQLTSVTHTNTSFTNESFTYDANGNETGTGYTTATGNEQTASPGYSYTYDADGNMITMTQTSTGDVWTYSYNFRNLMTGAVEKNGSGTILSQVTYTYDALDNRIGMDENGTQTWTLYDGSDPIMDFNGSGSLEMRYLNGPTGDLVDTVLARESAGGTIAWYLPDRLGTNRDLVNNSGSIIDHVDYSAFGTVLDESSPSNGDRLMGFAGLDRDTATGLNLAVHRVQNPWTGRWTSQDPLGFGGGDKNLYRYSRNSPAVFGDRSGLEDDPDLGSWWPSWLGYVDGGLGIPGFGGGVQVGPSNYGNAYLPGIHFYCGVQGPGGSVSVAPFQGITPGINAGLGGYWGLGGQGGAGWNPVSGFNPFLEVGGGVGGGGVGAWLETGDLNPLNTVITIVRWCQGKPADSSPKKSPTAHTGRPNVTPGGGATTGSGGPNPGYHGGAQQ
jgi:RHS repeat-associated protein